MMDKKRRTLERFKTALIVLLTLSALVLALRSPLLQSAGLPFLFDQGLANSTSLTPQTGSLPTAAVPARLVVGTSVSRYGIQYDQEAADNLFDQTAPLLGEALGSAESSSTLSEHEWQALLTGQCLYFGYLSPIPLSVLSGWLTGDKANSSLVDSTRHIVLAAGTDGMLTLSYQGVDGGFYQCATSLDASLHLEPVVSSVDPNGAFFAFEADLPSVVDPYTLFTEEEVSALVYDSANPLSLSDGDQLTSLLSALAFSDQNQAPVNDGYTYVDGEDTPVCSKEALWSTTLPGRAGTPPNLGCPAQWKLRGSWLTQPPPLWPGRRGSIFSPLRRMPTKRTTIPSFLAIASMAALFTSMTTDGLRCLR